MTYYAAKFAREAKGRPQDWIIIPAYRDGEYRLFYTRSKA